MISTAQRAHLNGSAEDTHPDGPSAGSSLSTSLLIVSADLTTLRFLAGCFFTGGAPFEEEASAFALDAFVVDRKLRLRETCVGAPRGGIMAKGYREWQSGSYSRSGVETIIQGQHRSCDELSSS